MSRITKVEARARVAQWVFRQLNYLTTRTSLLPIRHVFASGFVNYKKGCTLLATASDKVYQLLSHCLWFSPASSTTKTCYHDIAEILLKVALNTKNQSIKSRGICTCDCIWFIGLWEKDWNVIGLQTTDEKWWQHLIWTL
jgi:hypothetical protein